MNLAQLNIGRLRRPIDHPDTLEFANALDEVNAIADAAPGFVWRLQDDDGNATSFRVFEDDDTLLVNFSVWESLDALRSYVYSGLHLAYMRRRREWFDRLDQQHLVLWWTEGIPTIEEAKRRLDLLETNGPTPEAFTFNDPFLPRS